MTWLVAVAGRSVGALVLFGFALAVSRLLMPLVPARFRWILYDRGIQKRHPWKFALYGMAACYGTLILVAYLVA